MVYRRDVGKAVDGGNMEFRILGPLEVEADGHLLNLGGPQQRAVLALLLLNISRVVPVDQLAEEIWPGWPHERAFGPLRTCITHLRKALEPERKRSVPPKVLITQAPGYLLRVQPEQLDSWRFERLLQEGRSSLRINDPTTAAAKLQGALWLWRGSVLIDLARYQFTEGERIRMDELRLTALETRIEADLALGRHAMLIGELEALIRQQPLRERLYELLMIALYRSGQQNEALRVYRDIRESLREELGIDPNEHLQYLESAILNHDPELDRTPPAPDDLKLELAQSKTPTASGTPVAETVSAYTSADVFQLPPDINDFTGRERILEKVRGLFEEERVDGTTAGVVVAIAGKAGVGKTALAVRAAHQLRARYPDGQLYIDLRGVEAHPVESGKVLGACLRALGVKGGAIPASPEERAKLYRGRLADRRILVVLDNAAGETQVRPLLPGSATCATLITSRARLVLEGATTIDLDVLEPDQAVELLAKIAGSRRVAAEPEDARTIARLCGYLPLAVRIAGSKLATKRHWRLAKLARRFSDERRGLDDYEVGDLEVRGSFMLSYRGLEADEQRTFRLLGLLEAPHFPAWVAAAFLDEELADAEDLAEHLVDEQLLEVAGTDTSGETRYRFHDLLRKFARDRLGEEEPEASRKNALERVLGGYLTLASAADFHLQPGALSVARGIGRRWREGDPNFTNDIIGDPLSWFTAERTSLVTAVQQACQAGFWELAWELAGTLPTFFELRTHWGDWQYTHELALEAARRAGNQRGEAFTIRNLGRAYWEQDRWDDAVACFEECLPVFRNLGDRHGEARTLYNLGYVDWDHGRWDEAVASFEQCLEIYREFGDRRGEAIVLRSLGDVHRDQSRWEDAVVCFQSSLGIFREFGDRRWEAIALRSLGDVYRDQSRWDEAITCFEQCLPVFREFGDSHGEARTIRSLGRAYRERDRWDDAVNSFEQSLRIFRELGDRRWEARTLRSLGRVQRDQCHWDDAITSLERCLPVFRELGDPHGEARTLRSLGEVYRDQSRWEEAIAYFEKALVVFRDFGDRRWEAMTLRSLGDVYRNQSRWEEASGCFERCSTVFGDLGDRRWQAITLHSLGDLYRDQSRWDEALACLHRSLATFREFGDLRWEAMTLHSLELMGEQGDTPHG
jgi:DNA-binding SARP family transcriptional activator/uncharacterized protein HemY